jgi:hypothetical protein
MIAYDLIGDSVGDLNILNGDFVIDASDEQHIEDIIQSAPNWWKEYPQVGVNIQLYLSGSNTDQLNRNLKLQLQADGYNVTYANITQDNENFTLDTDAERV